MAAGEQILGETWDIWEISMEQWNGKEEREGVNQSDPSRFIPENIELRQLEWKKKSYREPWDNRLTTVTYYHFSPHIIT